MRVLSYLGLAFLQRLQLLFYNEASIVVLLGFRGG